MPDRSYSFSAADLGDTVSPSGTGTISSGADGWTFTDAWLDIPLLATDRDAVTPARRDDDIEVQTVLSVTSGTIGITVSDGAYAVTLRIGASLAWADPTDVTTVIPWTWPTWTTTFPQNQLHTYRILKRATAVWQLYVDGVFVTELPYLLGVQNTALASYRVGLPAGALAGVAVVQFIEAGLNCTVAPVEDVEAMKRSLPPALISKYNTLMRGLLRTTVGTLRHAYSAYATLADLKGASRRTVDEFGFDGTVDPELIPDPWTAGSGVTLDVVRQRVRVTLPSASAGWLFHDWQTANLGAQEIVLAATITVKTSPTILANNWTGLYLTVDDGVRQVSVGLARFGVGMYGWRLGYKTTIPGQDPYPVDVTVPHRVELRVTSDHVLLVVNDHPVDRVLQSAFPVTAVATANRVLIGTPNGTDALIDVEQVTAGVYLSDLSARPYLRQNAAERLIHPSGAERSDELRAWLDHRFGVMSVRGTARGIVTELKRLCATERVYLITVTTPAGWVLDVSFPDNIWLDLSSTLQTTYVEFGWAAPNFSLTRLAALIAAYLVPLSVIERIYWLCLITAATATASAGSSVNVAVESSRGFDVGDTVTLRNWAGSTTNTTTVTAVPDATHVTVALLTNTFTYASSTPPILRKVLRRT